MLALRRAYALPRVVPRYVAASAEEMPRMVQQRCYGNIASTPSQRRQRTPARYGAILLPADGRCRRYGKIRYAAEGSKKSAREACRLRGAQAGRRDAQHMLAMPTPREQRHARLQTRWRGVDARKSVVATRYAH